MPDYKIIVIEGTLHPLLLLQKPYIAVVCSIDNAYPQISGMRVQTSRGRELLQRQHSS